MLTESAALDGIILGLVWLAYFGIHSLLASLGVKRRISQHYPDYMPAYRLTFNFLAILLLCAPLYLSYSGQSIILWQFEGGSLWLTRGIAACAVIGFIISLRYYDGREFLGIRQWREHETQVEDQEHFQLSPLHYYVRHPWYTFALMLIWTRPMDSLTLISTVMITIYFFLGSRLEDNKLIHYYGDTYQRYRQQVPGLIPLPWKFLKPAQAEILMQMYRKQSA